MVPGLPSYSGLLVPLSVYVSTRNVFHKWWFLEIYIPLIIVTEHSWRMGELGVVKVQSTRDTGMYEWHNTRMCKLFTFSLYCLNFALLVLISVSAPRHTLRHIWNSFVVLETAQNFLSQKIKIYYSVWQYCVFADIFGTCANVGPNFGSHETRNPAPNNGFRKGRPVIG